MPLLIVEFFECFSSSLGYPLPVRVRVLIAEGLIARGLTVSFLLTFSSVLQGGLSPLGVDWLIEGTQGKGSVQARL